MLFDTGRKESSKYSIGLFQAAHIKSRRETAEVTPSPLTHKLDLALSGMDHLLTLSKRSVPLCFGNALIACLASIVNMT